MGVEERQRVLEALPASMSDAEASPPEGDRHFSAKVEALETLRGYFGRKGRRIYIASELTVYYPEAQRFSPDLLAVLDVDPHEREKWVVSTEGKGLDLALEIHVGGDRKKDSERNVQLYAALKIPEYFIYDRARQRLLGYRLLPGGTYAPILPQVGRYASQVLGLDLMLEEGRLRFYDATARILDTSELVAHLEQLVGTVQERLDEEVRLRQEEARLRQEEARLRAEAEARVAALTAENERLKKGKS